MSRKTDEKIVQLKEFRRRVTDPVITEVCAYWEGLRQGQSVPMRCDVDPRGIQNALEYAFILERIAPTMARFRLAGLHLSDVMGMEVRGMPFTSFFSINGRKEVARALEAMFDGPQIVEITVSAETGIGKPPLEGKIMLLPLKSDLGDVSRALGCFVTHGKIGRTPRRFQIDAIETRWIGVEERPNAVDEGYREGRKLFEQEHNEALVDAQPGAGFAEDNAPFEAKLDENQKSPALHRSKSQKGKPLLRLLKFDD